MATPRKGAAQAAPTRNDNVKFMSVSEFKTAIGATSLQVLRNPKTDKLFMASDTGQNYRVQGDLDPAERMTVLVEDNDLENACLINSDGAAEVLATL